MSVKTTIEFKSSQEPVVVETRGLHSALGYIEDYFVRAKEGGSEVKRVEIVTQPEVFADA